MNKLLETAHLELEKLKTMSPSWEVYQRISALCASISFLEKDINYKETEFENVIDEMSKNIGEHRVFEILKTVLSDFKKDLDCVSPNLSNILISKIKESR